MTPRIVKEHEVRKKEIVETAERLFLEYGYEETPVELIIKEVGIAKGTFYHYFKTKEDVLNILVDQLIEDVTSNVRKISENSEGDALVRMFKVSFYFRTLAIGKEKLSDYIHEEKNEHLHLKIQKRVMPVLIDCYAKLIEEGNREGLFNTGDPTLTAAAMLGASNQLGEGHHEHAGRAEVDQDLLHESVKILERILNTREGLLLEYLKKMEVLK
ncbi:MAG: TetR/AcrR family transcriptional regulator [Thermoplasmatota archaeon]